LRIDHQYNYGASELASRGVAALCPFHNKPELQTAKFDLLRGKTAGRNPIGKPSAIGNFSRLSGDLGPPAGRWISPSTAQCIEIKFQYGALFGYGQRYHPVLKATKPRKSA
jgi:hypothetical protein